MRPHRTRRRGGFALLMVTLALGLLATLAFLASRTGPMASRLASGAASGQKARYVAEAGFHHALWRVRQAGCDGYAALPATAFGPDTYTATVTPTSGSPVSIVATSTLSDGGGRVYGRDGVRIDAPPSTTQLRPGAEGRETTLDSEAPAANLGADNDIRVAEYDEMHALIAFDLSAIPPHVRVLGATLQLYLEGWSSSPPPTPFSIHRVTRAWTEGTGTALVPSGDGATWNTADGAAAWVTPGGDYDPTPLDVETVLPAYGWYSWDVTAAAVAWHDGDQPNHGLLIRTAGGFKKAKFTSGDSSDVALRPVLTLELGCECGSPCSGRVLMLVRDAASLTAQEDLRRTALLSLGYEVVTITASASLAAIEAAAAGVDAVYVPEEIDSADVGNKLTGLATGVVSEEVNLADDLGIASDWIFKTRTDLDVVDDSHYIIEVFGTGLLPLFTSDQPVFMLSGSLAPDLRVLGELYNVGSQWKPALATLEKSKQMYTGGQAAGRRVQLPWGGNDFDLASLNDDGLELLRRALEWAAAPPELDATLTPVADAYGKSDKPDEKRGGENQIKVQLDKRQSYLRFDVSSLPAGSIVQEATLWLWVDTNSLDADATMDALRLSESWDESEVSWSQRTALDPWTTPGGTSTPPVVASVAVLDNFQNDWVELDLTSLVQEWVDGITPNHGVILLLDQPKEVKFSSKEEGNAEKRPRLEVRYVP